MCIKVRATSLTLFINFFDLLIAGLFTVAASIFRGKDLLLPIMSDDREKYLLLVDFFIAINAAITVMILAGTFTVSCVNI